MKFGGKKASTCRAAFLGSVAALGVASSIAHADTQVHTIAHAHLEGHGMVAAESAGKQSPSKQTPGQAEKSKSDEKKPEEKKSYYVRTRGYRLEPEPDVRNYVRDLGKTYKEFEGIDWLDVGLDSRVRFEYRHNDYRPWSDTTTNPATSQRRNFPNSLWLKRTRAYLGVKSILDPFRFVVEFQDSRAFNSIYQLQGQDVNQVELLQGYGELHFKDAFGKDDLGNGRPLIARAGRFHLELLDRRLIANNEFRNTTNNFEGFRVKVGQKDNDWDVDSFLMRPVVRYPEHFDRPEWGNWIYGTVISIRRWSEYATIQPYFLGRKQYADLLNPSTALRVKRDIQAPGLRVYGVLGDFDYDFDVNKQFGQQGEFRDLGTQRNAVQTTVQHDAIAYSLEAGYTFSTHPWKPRVSLEYNYGSGNKSPFDSVNQTFDQFYGFNQPFSRNDYFAWNNLRSAKGRVEFTPYKNLQIDSTFHAFWLASAAAAWDRANLFAPLGNRGDFLGTEIDFRARYKLSEFISLTASYARFWPGDFTQSFGPRVAFQPFFPQSFPGQTGTTNGLTQRPSDFFYLEASVNAFGDGKPIASNPARDFIALASPETHEKVKPPSWTDVYVGLNGGGAWSNPTSNVTLTPLGGAPASAPVAALSTPIDRTNSLAGFVGGMQIGLNWKIADRFLTGVEADLQGVSGNTDTKWQIGTTSAGGETFVSYAQRTETLNYLGTIRGRLGFLATPKLALYGTGGMAYGGITSNAAIFTQRVGGTNITQGNPVFQGSNIGWAAGGGADWAFMPNWSVKIDYLRYDLGEANARHLVVQPSGFFAYSATSATRFSGNLIHAGVNRHFDLFAAATAEKKE